MHRHSKPRFIDRTRRHRAEEVFKLKHRIAEGKFKNFSSWDRFGDGLSWADIYFIGSDKWTLWNATMMTIADAKKNAISTAAWDQAYDALSDEDRKRLPKLKFEAISDRPGYSILVEQEQPTFPQFDGRTLSEQTKFLEDILDVEVFEKVEFDYSYQYGIGLDVVMDVPLLTVDILTDFVDRFVKDEREWVSTIPPIHLDAPVYFSNALDIEYDPK